MNRYFKLLFAVASIYLFIAFVVPYINSSWFLSPMQKMVKEYDINTSAFFYTDNISSNPDILKHTDL